MRYMYLCAIWASASFKFVLVKKTSVAEIHSNGNWLSALNYFTKQRVLICLTPVSSNVATGS